MKTRSKSNKLFFLLPIIFILIIIVFIITGQCSTSKQHHIHIRDYAEIADKGILRVATEYNSISYHLKGDTLSGFDYELIQTFARQKKIKLEITPDMSFEHRIQKLQDGSYDIITCGIATTSELKDSLLFTIPIARNKWVLVQRKTEDSLTIQNQLDLAKCTLHIVKGSPASFRIKNLGNEIGDTIYINEIEKYGQEQLISLVAHGDIDYAVCDESIAKAAVDSFPQIDTHINIGFTQFYSWAVNKKAPALLDTLNVWLKHFMQEDEYLKIYKKYF